MQKLRKNREGFTIIEVLIVLAIAALIMLIVFLAVPALQRNSRNNGRRNDVSRIAAGVNDYIANNNGALVPNGLAFTGIVAEQGNLAQFGTGDIANPAASTIITGAQGALTDDANGPRIRLVNEAKCGTSGATVNGTDRQAAIQYQLETGSTTVHTDVCLDV